MDSKPLSVHEVAELTGITNRTLHYYDEIGLLKPSIVTESKYRLYTNDDLAKLQEILFYREVGFALKEISGLMAAEMNTRTEALKKQIQILEAQKKRIDDLIELAKDEIVGKQTIRFDAFSKSNIYELQKQYRTEIIGRWSNTKYYKDFESVFSRKEEKIQQETWQEYLSEHFYRCDKQMLLYLGELYITDERFSNYINRFGKGNLAGFFNEAIKIFGSNR